MGRGVFEGRRADLHLPRRRPQHEDSRPAARHARRAHEFRRRWPSARPVLRRAQHRDRFEGQSLHDGNLRRQARAEVLVQRTQERVEARTGDGVATMSMRKKTTLGLLVGVAIVGGGLHLPAPPPWASGAGRWQAGVGRWELGTPLSAQPAPANGEWRTYGASLASHRYSPLDQISAANFS